MWLDLDLTSDATASLRARLHDDERARVDAYATPVLQARATVRVARRREAVAAFLSASSDEVRIERSPSGAPFAIGPSGERVEVSSSHSGAVGLVAVATRRHLGCDVEALDGARSERFGTWIATPREARELEALHGAARERATVRLWARKEAVAKATGHGIEAGFAALEVPVEDASSAVAFSAAAGGPSWWCYDLAVPRDGLVAALVCGALPSDDESPLVTVAHL